MAAYEVLLLNTAVPQIQAAQSGDTYVVPRDIAFSAALTLSAGTANGVPYLNGSKVLTTGSALTFDGTEFKVGASSGNVLVQPSNVANAKLYMRHGSIGNNSGFEVDVSSNILFLHAGSETMRLTATGLKSSIAGTNADPVFSYTSDTNTGIFFPAADKLGFTAGGGSDDMVLTTTGLGIGTNNPGARLDVRSGATTFTAQLSSTGTNTYAATASTSLTNTMLQLIGGGASGATTGIRLSQLGSFELYFGGVQESSGAGAFVWQGYGGSAYAERMRLDSSGNLGLGVTPSASWSSMRALQNGTATFANDTGSPRGRLITNAVYNGSDYLFLDASANHALNYTQDGATGVHQWRTSAAAGTSPNTATLSNLMTLLANGNLGIGETNPGYKLQVIGTSQLSLSAAGTQQALQLNNSDTTAGTQAVKLGFSSSGVTKASINAAVYGNDYMTFNVGSDTERARITSGGDFQTSSGGSVQVGGTAARATTAGTNRLDIFDGTAPVGTLANGVSFYSTAGEARVMDAAGNATLLSPHDTETNEWIFHSKHTPTGKVLRIDVERLLKFVNDHFGLDAVQEFIEE